MKKVINEVIKQSEEKIKAKDFDHDLFADFVKEFYSEIVRSDYSHYLADSLYYKAKSGFDCFSKRKAGEVKIVVDGIKESDQDFKHIAINIVNDDSPFLVDSVVSYFEKSGIVIKNVIHPVYTVVRDKDGSLKKIVSDKKEAEKDNSSHDESLIQLHLDKDVSESEIEVIVKDLRDILDAVALVVGDWKTMESLAKRSVEEIRNAERYFPQISEIEEFMSWVIGGNFIFLGARECDVKKNKDGHHELVEVKGNAFGIFRSKNEKMVPLVMNNSWQEVGESVKNPYVVEIIKSRYRSRVHRGTNAERIRIQKVSKDGEVTGEYRFVGLFTSAAYYAKTDSIPLIRNKVAKVIADSGYKKGSHNYKDLISVLESYPRDELFQISAQDLLKNAVGIVSICGRSQARFFARKDKFKRFVSCLIYTPRDRSNSELRGKIKNYLAEIYNGEVADSFVQVTESNLTRQHVIIRTKDEIPEVNEALVEAEIYKMCRVWSDDLVSLIRNKFDNHNKLAIKYRSAFSVSYKNRFDPKQAAEDITFIEDCHKTSSVIFNIYEQGPDLIHPNQDDELGDFVNLKIYNPEKEIPLSEIMPILESFGVNVIQEQIYVVKTVEEERVRVRQSVWIHHFKLKLGAGSVKFTEEVRNNFEESVELVWNNQIVVGVLNSLILSAGLNWKQVYMLSAYVKYVAQANFRYSKSFVSNTIVKNGKFTALLVKLFETKFDVKLGLNVVDRAQEVEKISAKIEGELNKINDVAVDTVFRSLYTLIGATLRTNYYQESNVGGFKGYVSFKFNCSKINFLPLPLPHAEIFVYSPNVEAVHLRGGKVARGGLRWSDRNEDFRTEILGLMKAQMTKNAVIVPVGSKGGFVVKKNLSGLSRDEAQKEAIECYKTFLRGLLDVTDNVVNNKIVHPRNVIMYDESDPYLVVAADKGTATFSDIANSISSEYNFWLGDAFASGGSVGYDHKKMGITAKGAWVSVMRHFSEMGIDTQKEDFTCVGIGDMAGDVFGNGMLLSKHIKLVAAFNHMHIFLDPNPDSATSYKERKRMFSLPRSSWTDYDVSLISKGGGIFERSAKSIKISSEAQQVLGIEDKELAPEALISAILRAPVGLIWNGGIGTYVKSSSESHQEVGDRANDILRVNGNELRCKVIGEGGNLGFTQKGRIEYALNGGRINTDAMDNSAGVDCSDHEVNIKIALASAMRSGKIDLGKRNKILEDMSDEVSNLVLRDNYLQTQAISVANFQGSIAIDEQSRFISRLEKAGFLNREIEFLPSTKEIDRRRINKIGMSRPELCVMLSYSKMDIYNSILSSKILNDKYFEKDLLEYFPKLMQEKFSDEILNHQLRKEIIATQITNFVVNRLGITFVNNVCHNTGFNIVDVVTNIIIACDSFGLRELWEEVENLDNIKVSHQMKMQIFLICNKLVERSVVWLLRNPSKGGLSAIVTRFKKIADEFLSIVDEVLSDSAKESYDRNAERYRLNNIDKKLALRIAALDPASSVFDISEISADSRSDTKTIAKIYFAVGNRFSLKWLRGRVSSLTLDNQWHKMSAKIIQDDLYSYQMKLAKAVISSCNDKVCEVEFIDRWLENHDFLIDRFDKMISELRMQENPDLSVFVVALSRLKPLVQ